MGTGIDDVDRTILEGLFKNARRAKTEEIAQDAGVAHSTVSKRIRRLETNGIIQGYKPIIDYQECGYHFEVLFICTAPISQRDQYIGAAMGLDNVIKVRELMVGQENVHITVVGRENDDITKIAKQIDEIGFEVSSEILVRGEDQKLPRDLGPTR